MTRLVIGSSRIFTMHIFVYLFLRFGVDKDFGLNLEVGFSSGQIGAKYQPACASIVIKQVTNVSNQIEESNAPLMAKYL